MSNSPTNLSAERQALLNKWLSGSAGTAEQRIQPRGRELNEIPAAPSQERLWFLEQFTPGTAAYHLPIALRVTGALDVGALQASLRDLIHRHESLRTTLQSRDGKLLQVIAETAEPAFCMEGADASLEQRLTDEWRRPFDLAAGPLMRTALFRLGAEDHVLLITLHHIITDGWSNALLLNELGRLYDAHVTGRAPALEPVPLQFADYAIWQKQWLEGGAPLKQVEYWQQQLKGTEPLLLLPTDHPRPPVHTAEGGEHSFTLEGEVVAHLRALGKQEGSTTFMLVMAAFQTLLHRYTNQRDIVVGMPMFNRARASTEKVAGFFANTGVIRAGFGPEATFRSVLRAVKAATLDATRHQEVPFDRIVEALKLPRDPSHTPLIQAMLTIGAAQDRDLAWHGIMLRSHPVIRTATMFDLTLELAEQPEAFQFCLVYRTDLFEQATIARMAANFITLLRAIAADPDARVRRLDLLAPTDRQLLANWNETATDYPTDLTIFQRFEQRALHHPDRIALTCGDTHLTYAELNGRANQLARFLRRHGLGRNTLAAVAMERSVAMVVSLLAIQKAGGAYVPVDPTYPDERINCMLEDAQPPVLLTQQHLLDRFAGRAPAVIALDAAWPEVAAEPATNLDVGVTMDDLAYVIFTSGSTGRPKGAMNSHAGISNRLLWMQAQYGLTAEDSVLQKTPFSFDVSVWEFFWPLLAGARLVMARPEGHKDVDYLVEVITAERITTIHFVPSMLQMFLSGEGVERCTSLRRVICSGEALPYTLQERFFERLPTELHNLYGPTEAAVDVTYWQCRQGDPRRIVPIGRPVANTQMHVLDEERQPVPVGVVGELYIGGVQVGQGYWGRPDLTAERFIPHQSGRLYRTGDLGRWLPDGTLEYLGRIDGQVKVRGVRMELGEIEAALVQHEQVREAVVLLHKLSEMDVRLVTYFTAEAGEGEAPAPSELRQFLGRLLPDYMIPAHFVPMRELPLSPNGKVDRKALPGLDAIQPVRSGEPVVPLENDTEHAIARIWSEVLKVETISANDNIFDLGGNSLLILRISEALRKQLQVTVSIVDLFRYTTVRRLAQFLDQRETAPSADRARGIMDRVARQRSAMNQRREQRTGGR